MMFSKILGTGAYLPEQIIENSKFESYLDTSDAWIQERTGIKQRRLAGKTDTTASMGARAAQQALETAGLKANEVDLIIVATCTPDKLFPSTACLIQQALNIPACPAFDVSAACSGFIYALTVADQFICSGTAKNALVIGSEVMSKTLDWEDRGTCILFGDGAGAVVLGASEQAGILSTHINADGTHKDLLYVNQTSSRPEDEQVDPYLRMQGNMVFKLAVKWLGQVALDTLKANDLSEDAIDWIVPHQANIRIIQATANKLKLSMDNVIVTVDKHGNTSGASIPLALDAGIRDKRIKPGQLLLLEAFGGGLTWGAALVRY